MECKSGNFSIQINWIPSENKIAEVHWTSANIQIVCGHDNIATRIYDLESETVNTVTRLSAYHFALWIATNWWRILYEPIPSKLNADWRMSHLVAGAGNGYIWPNLAFASDGKMVDIFCRQSPGTCSDSAIYLNSFHEQISLENFVSVADCLVTTVISRLDARNVSDTSLHTLWNAITKERKDPETAYYRRLEALMGFDPDDAPDDIIEKITMLAITSGTEAIDEIAPLCSGLDPLMVIQSIIELSVSNGIKAKLNIPIQLSNSWNVIVKNTAFPTSQCAQLAREARDIFAIPEDRVSNEQLGEIFGIQPRLIQDTPTLQRNQKISLATRDISSNLKLFFRSQWETGRRFEMARFIADSVVAPLSDHWLASTGLKTSRQKMQRAFAAEFLVPINRLLDYLAEDFSSEACDEAAKYFDVSPFVISNQLCNYGYIRRDDPGTPFDLWNPSYLQTQCATY